jgi:hypothetical protein
MATVQRSHNTDAREQRRPVKLRDQRQRFYRGLPFIGIVFRFRQFGIARPVSCFEQTARSFPP